MKRIIQFDDIPYFLAFGRASNTSEAAQKMAMSQPAFNERLRRIEQSVEPALFSWDGNKRVLSAFGRDVHKVLAADMQTLTASLDSVFEEAGSDDGRPLKVVGRSEVFSRMAGALSQFPHNLMLQSCSSRMAVDLVQNGEADVAISALKPTNPHLVIRKLFVSRAVVAVSKSLLQGHGELLGNSLEPDAWARLKTLRWAAYGESDRLFESFLKVMNWNRQDICVSLFCDNWQALWRFVKGGQGCAVLPAAYVELSRDVVAIPPAPHFETNPFFFVSPQSKLRRARVRAFFDFAKEALKH
jgi:DNA-binding transcriptional LysR family regulator